MTGDARKAGAWQAHPLRKGDKRQKVWTAAAALLQVTVSGLKFHIVTAAILWQGLIPALHLNRRDKLQDLGNRAA